MLPSLDESAQPRGLSVRACRLLAGLDVGFAGGLAVIAWLCLHSLMSGELWWAKLNVSAGPFFGSAVYSMGFGRATLAGASLLLLLYATVSALFAQLVPLLGYARNSLLALAYAALLNLAADRWLWPRLDPFATAYFPFQAMLAGHLLFALALGRFTSRFCSLAHTFGDSAWVLRLFPAPEPPNPPPAPAQTGQPEQAAGVDDTPPPPPHC